MMAFMSDVDRLQNRRERAMVHGAEAASARACAVEPSRLAQVNRLIDHVAWMRLLRLRLTAPEVLAEFPPAWIEAASKGQFVLPGGY